MNAVEVLTINA